MATLTSVIILLTAIVTFATKITEFASSRAKNQNSDSTQTNQSTMSNPRRKRFLLYVFNVFIAVLCLIVLVGSMFSSDPICKADIYGAALGVYCLLQLNFTNIDLLLH